MVNIQYNEIIIGCEACGEVKRFQVQTQQDCDKIYSEFKCENKCGRNLYGFISLGSIQYENLEAE